MRNSDKKVLQKRIETLELTIDGWKHRCMTTRAKYFAIYESLNKEISDRDRRIAKLIGDGAILERSLKNLRARLARLVKRKKKTPKKRVVSKKKTKKRVRK